MPAENRNAPPARARHLFQPLKLLDFFAGLNALVETADLADNSRVAKDKGARRPSEATTQDVPPARDEFGDRISAGQGNGAPAGHTFSPSDCPGDITKKGR